MSGYLRLFGVGSSSTIADAAKGIVITGGSRGLGYCLAAAFLARGHAVVITSRTAQVAAQAVERLKQAHGEGAQVHGLECDVRDWRQVDALADYAGRVLESVDLWINNAALSQSGKPSLVDSDPEELSTIVQTNLTGAILGSRAAMRIMRQRANGGKIFLIDGTGAWGNATPGNIAYGATKRALTQLKVSLVAETKSGAPGVTAHIASPGMMATDLLFKAVTNQRSAKFINILSEAPETVAEWLAPRMLAAKGNGQYIKYLTPRGVIWRFLTARRRRNRFLVEEEYGRKAE